MDTVEIVLLIEFVCGIAVLIWMAGGLGVLVHKD
mgnify:CR=1 FL=1